MAKITIKMNAISRKAMSKVLFEIAAELHEGPCDNKLFFWQRSRTIGTDEETVGVEVEVHE